MHYLRKSKVNFVFHNPKHTIVNARLKIMFKILLAPLTIIGIALSSISSGLVFNRGHEVNDSPQYAEPGMVAYAASYSSDAKDEPKFTTQNNTTFQYLNLGSTLDYYRGDSVKVGIIDSGINYDHEDFMVSGSTKVKGDSKYYSYQSSSWVYYGASSHGYSYIDDSLGHGTNVAATVAAAINSVGGTGLAPNVELYVYKVTNSNNGYEFGAIQNALMDAKTLGLDVINMSFQSYEHAVSYGSSSMAASTGCSTILSYYLNQAYNAGITLIGAAGNFNTSEPSYPGSNTNVINVGSLNSTGTDKAPFSNYGSTIDLVAPGYVYVADEASNTAYTSTQGTSFSAPLVTAAIALYKQKNPSATPSQIESALYASCDDIDDSGSQYTNWAGHGSLNIARFLGVQEDAPTDIEINNPEIVDGMVTLEIGDSLDLDWTVTGNGSFDDSVNFYILSGGIDVVSVDDNGTITAIGEGTDYVVIESNVDPNVYNQVYVTVIKSGSSAPTVSSVTISPSSLSLDLNGTTTGNLSATVNGDNNPSQLVSWSTSNDSVATVSQSGVVTAKSTGTAKIRATSQLDNTKYGEIDVTVTDSTVHVTGVTLNKSSTSIVKGSTETLTASVSPNNATNKNVSWTSSNTSVATVNSGVVTAINTGSAVISVTTADGAKTANCTVTVTAPNTQTLIITRSSFATAGGYAWYDWSQATSDNTTISGKAELYTTTTTSMQFNKGNGNKNGAIFNSVALPGSITKIEATSYQTTIRSWTAYVTSTACSINNSSSLVFGNNKTTVGTATPAVGQCTSFGTSSAGYSFFCLQEGVNNASYLSEIKITYVPKSLTSIAVKTSPTTEYESGESFDPTGLVITATYSDNTTEDIAYAGNESKFSFIPSTSSSLNTDDRSVTITYKNQECSLPISVVLPKTLTSITLSGQTTSFAEGDAFSFGGTVTAHFLDTTSEDVTLSSTFTGYNMTTTGNQTVTVSYTRKGITKTAEYQISVNKGTLSSISLSGQTTEYVKNQDFSFDGTCTAIFVNNYEKTVVPTSVTSPNMATAGEKTITVSYTYNGATKTASYTINVASNRQVIETTYSSGYIQVGTITYPSNTETISSDTLTTSTSGYTNIESNSIRLGSGSNTGKITITSSTTNITKVVVSAKRYGSDSNVTLSIGGTSNTITGSYANYTKEFSAAVKSVDINTTTNGRRAYVQSITIYQTGLIPHETDISNTEDVQNLEVFIDTYLHFGDYNQNLGYCKDSEHHYYSTTKSAFNDLNEHQRTLFTTNSAYTYEWARLSSWASANGETLNSSSILEKSTPFTFVNNVMNNDVLVLAMISLLFSSAAVCTVIVKKRRKNY